MRKLIRTIIYCVAAAIGITAGFIFFRNEENDSSEVMRYTETEESAQKTVYLTFDDGPSANTVKVLDILKENNINATFFIIGADMTDTGKEALKRTVDEGNIIGLHAYDHVYSRLYSTVDYFLADYEKLSSVIKDITGIEPKIYRFPGGSYNSCGRWLIPDIIKAMNERGYTYFDWNVSAEDSVGTPTAYKIMSNIFDNIEKINQPVILMHDSPSNNLTAELLPDIISKLKDMGYEFDTLDNREPCQFNW